MRGPTIVVLVALSIAGCGGGCSGASEPRTSSSSAQRTEASGTEEDRDEPSIEADPGPVPVLSIHATLDRYDRSVAFRVENRGTEQIELSTRLTLEKQQGDDWQPASAGLSLRDSCEAPVPDCVTLAPGAVYIPPAWTGLLGAADQPGDAQCGCEACTPAPAGTYRVVVKSCSGAHTVPGEPLVLP